MTVLRIAAVLMQSALAIGIIAQTAPQPSSAIPSIAADPVGSEGKPLTFDTVSIREDKSIPDPQKNPLQFGPTPDGYRLKGLPLIFVVMAAYAPSSQAELSTFAPDHIKGLPTWATYTRYDIDAKVSESDLQKWKDPTLQRPMLRAMLQALLADRFKLVFHRKSEEEPIFELTLAKRGPQFKPSEATTLAEVRQKHPDVHENIGGTILASTPEQTTYFNVTMSTFCSLVQAGRPVQDKTGLTGRYDITFRTEPPPLPGEPLDTS